MPVQFTASRDEVLIINQIAKRAVAMAKKNGIAYDYVSAQMDIEACHCGGNPIDLSRLLNADDANFGHDVFGIRRYLDRDSGALTDCFSPRFSAPVAQ